MKIDVINEWKVGVALHFQLPPTDPRTISPTDPRTISATKLVSLGDALTNEIKRLEKERDNVLELMAESIMWYDPEEKRPYLNVNDCFVPASDSEDVTLQDIPELYKIWKESGDDGLVEWVRVKREKEQGDE